MSLQSRVERLERAIGADGAPCPDCARREAKAREPGQSYDRRRFEETSRHSMSSNCPRCGRPFTVDLVVIMPREVSAA